MKEHTRYFLDRKSFFGKAAVICLLLAAVLRTAAALINRDVFSESFTLVETLLPIGSCLLYVVFVFLFGRKGFFFSVIPFIFGMLGMIMRLFSYDSLLQEQAATLHAFSSVLLCLVLTALYAATVFGGIRTKWLLPPLFVFAFLVHLFWEVYPVIREGYKIAFPLIIAEVGLDLIFLGMCFASLTIKKKTKPDGGFFHHGKKGDSAGPVAVQNAVPAADAAVPAPEAAEAENPAAEKNETEQPLPESAENAPAQPEAAEAAPIQAESGENVTSAPDADDATQAEGESDS